MKERKCSIEGCEGKHYARGWCGMHYERWRKHGDPEFTKTAPTGEPLKFLQDLIDNPRSGCVIWPYGKYTNGYGKLLYEGRGQNAHRISLILATGKDPKDLVAAHSCRNRDCVNPSCLSWETEVENQRDRLRDGTDSRGEKQWLSKLTEDQVLAIYRDPRTQQAIAEKYGVSQGTVSAIKNGYNWSWLTGKNNEKTKEKESLCIV